MFTARACNWRLRGGRLQAAFPLNEKGSSSSPHRAGCAIGRRDFSAIHRQFVQFAVNSAIAVLATAVAGCSDSTVDTQETALEPAVFVGSAACADCHASEYELWRSSHHYAAMLPPTDESVAGGFDDQSYEYFGRVSLFSRDADNFFVRTENQYGEETDFRVAYTFGVSPLQQYLIEAPGGRLQALSIAWDSRSAAAGGQRWFHLYPNENVRPGDALHWTGDAQNWNFMCAECHSTNVQKNFERQSRTYATTWSEVNVGCEGCHGPGSRHVSAAAEEAGSPRRGLLVNLDDRGAGHLGDEFCDGYCTAQ